MATVTLTDLTYRLRLLISDTQKKRWKDDDELELYINWAVVQWTTDIPIAASASFVVNGNEYTLPDDAVAVSYVAGYFENASYTEHVFPGDIEPGMWQTDYEPKILLPDHPEHGKFYLPRAPIGSTFTLYYGALHPWLVVDEDPEINVDMDFGLRRWGEMAVLSYAAYLAHNPSASFRAFLEQWAGKIDLNVGNPLAEEAQRWLDFYNALLDQHARPTSFRFLEVQG